jgi:hypothetical protein
MITAHHIQEWSAKIDHCYLCGRPRSAVVMFIPYDDETTLAVLTLRTNPPKEGKAAGIVYGLCNAHRPDLFADGDDIATQVEEKMIREAAEIRRRAS